MVQEQRPLLPSLASQLSRLKFNAYFMCGTFTSDINMSPYNKKQHLHNFIMEVFSNIPREDLKMACSPFLSRLEKVFAAKDDFIW